MYYDISGIIFFDNDGGSRGIFRSLGTCRRHM